MNSGANAVALVDLNKADAEAAAKDLVEWFGEFSMSLQFITYTLLLARIRCLGAGFVEDI